MKARLQATTCIKHTRPEPTWGSGCVECETTLEGWQSWTIAAALKAVGGVSSTLRGFEAHPLRTNFGERGTRHGLVMKANSATQVKENAEVSSDEEAAAYILTLHTGEKISLAHLAASELDCPCEDIGRDIVIYVHYTPHCYSEKFDPEKNKPEEIICTDGPDRDRVFCPIRHGLSPRLPALIADLPNRRVHQTAARRNYVYLVPLQIEGQTYEIYFMLQRAGPKDKADLRLTVESAYPVDTPTPLPKRPNKIRFQVLALKVLKNQAVVFAAR
jgi:hypothetical protein